MSVADIFPKDHLERLFGRDLRQNGWSVELPEPVNDDILIDMIDPSILQSLLKRSKG